MAIAKKWDKALNRGGNFKVTLSTKVCSNHFAAGYCSDSCSVPTLFLKGYDVERPNSCHSPRKRCLDETTPHNKAVAQKKSRRHFYRQSTDDIEDDPAVVTSPPLDHDYEQYDPYSCSRSRPLTLCSNSCHQRRKSVKVFKDLCQKNAEVEKLQRKLEGLQKENNELRKNRSFAVDQIKNDDGLVRFYTGLQNYSVFLWLYKKVEAKAKKLHYFRGASSFKLKRHQTDKKHLKGGKKRKLPLQDELFLTLVRLRVGLTEKDLAFRFGISQAAVSQMCTTWISFLGKELQGLIFWPNKEQVKQYHPKCFHKYDNVIGIIDCTEGILEKPSIAKAQSQTHSTYKSRNTWKKLLCITPAGTVSFISNCYGGLASDRYITETCGLLNKLDYGDNLMADKGFNISDLLVCKGSQLIIPPFVRDKGKFSKKRVTKTSDIAKARIHVERAIARIKDLRILQGAFPLTLKDLIDDIFVICAAITNLAPALVPM